MAEPSPLVMANRVRYSGARARAQAADQRGIFFIFILKKTKFQKYMPNREIFKNGRPVAHPVGDMT